jgi:hypothetical protein
MGHPVLVPEVTYTSLVCERRAAVAVVTINDPPHNRRVLEFDRTFSGLMPFALHLCSDIENVDRAAVLMEENKGGCSTLHLADDLSAAGRS